MISTFFSGELFFFGIANLKLIEKPEKLQGSPGACSPGKIWKICMLRMAVLVPFEKFFGRFY